MVDVRADIAAGGEPLDRILEAAERVPPGGSFLLIVPFEPVPLLRLLGRRGFTSASERREEGEYHVLVTRNS